MIKQSAGEPTLIQGGMGVGVSDWKLARAVSILGQLGVVSGTGINTVMIRRLQDGDKGGHVRRALSAFPDVDQSEEILKTYFLEYGRFPGQAYRLCPMPSLKPSLQFQRTSMVAAFVEVYLAKEGHSGMVGMNLLEKGVLSNLPILYGAMLAGVDYILMGAGIPKEIPGVLDQLSNHREAALRVMVSGAKDSETRIYFDPKAFLLSAQLGPLTRPKFLAIVSSATLAAHLVRKSTGKVDGLVIEGPSAGGHNAPPRGPMTLNEDGEPVYGAKDIADIDAIRELGLPFWLAGSFATHQKLQEALQQGATGVQVGTAFAFCQESGLDRELKETVIRERILDTASSSRKTFTDPLASPTGFPFKVIQIAGSLSEQREYESRERRCDLGYLRQPVEGNDGSMVYRCPAEPVNDYLRKGGLVEDTRERRCLCNALMANVNLAQVNAGHVELPLLTAGDDMLVLRQFFALGSKTYHAADVVRTILGSQAV